MPLLTKYRWILLERYFEAIFADVVHYDRDIPLHWVFLLALEVYLNFDNSFWRTQSDILEHISMLNWFDYDSRQIFTHVVGRGVNNPFFYEEQLLGKVHILFLFPSLKTYPALTQSCVTVHRNIASYYSLRCSSHSIIFNESYTVISLYCHAESNLSAEQSTGLVDQCFIKFCHPMCHFLFKLSHLPNRHLLLRHQHLLLCWRTELSGH